MAVETVSKSIGSIQTALGQQPQQQQQQQERRLGNGEFLGMEEDSIIMTWIVCFSLVGVVFFFTLQPFSFPLIHSPFHP